MFLEKNYFAFVSPFTKQTCMKLLSKAEYLLATVSGENNIFVFCFGLPALKYSFALRLRHPGDS